MCAAHTRAPPRRAPPCVLGEGAAPSLHTQEEGSNVELTFSLSIKTLNTQSPLSQIIILLTPLSGHFAHGPAPEKSSGELVKQSNTPRLFEKLLRGSVAAASVAPHRHHSGVWEQVCECRSSVQFHQTLWPRCQ